MHMIGFHMFVLVAMVLAAALLGSVKVAADRWRPSFVPVRVRRQRR